jgi:poly(3-hydroxybutyrate) depolymerase
LFYHLHEWQRASLTPARLAAKANMQLMRHPMNPLAYTGGGRAWAASLELFEAAVRPYGKPAFGLHETRIEGEAVPVAERIVHRRPFGQLKRFEREGRTGDAKLLIVAPLSGHFATLLRGTVAAMLPAHDVYITDWRDARAVPVSDGAFHLDDYIDYVIDFLRHLGPDTHVMAVCQPSVPVLAATAVLAAEGDPVTPRSLTLMGGPIDTRINPTTPNKLATSRPIEWFERNVIQRVPITYPGFMRRVYPGFLQLGGFMTMNLDRHLGAHMRLFDHLVQGDGDGVRAHRAFYDEYRAVMDLPAEYYLETVARVFQRHDLPLGRFRYRGRRLAMEAIRETSLMTVEGEKDDISGPGQTRAAHDLCPAIPAARRQHYLQASVGHYGVFNGRRWAHEIAPRIASFIEASRVA